MAHAIFVLCTLTSLACAWALLGNFRRTGHRLLFWSGLCFCAMTLNNLLLLLDKLVFADIDLRTPRLLTALVAVALLLYGLIMERD
ncbi:MAG: DUF5985 family protein [Gammaproteobacteria bacterium]